MATVTRYINTASTPGGDGTTSATSGVNRAYASLSEWEAAEQTDLVTAGDIHKVICIGGQLIDGAVKITGWTTGASNYIVLTVDPGSRHDGTPGSGFYHQSNTDWNFGLEINQAHTKVEYLECRTTSTNGTYGAIVPRNTNNCTFVDCIATSASGPGFERSNGGTSPGEACVFINCLAYNCNTSGFFVTDYRHNKYYNCTAANCNIGFGTSGTAGNNRLTARNCVAYNNTSAQFQNGSSAIWTSASGYNATSEANTTNVPGSNNIANIVVGDFSAPASDDYSLASGSNLAEAGEDLTTLFNNEDVTEFDVEIVDIIGTTRPQDTNWDIGAFELVAATGYTLTANTGSFTLSGNTANLLIGRQLTANTGSFALSGIAADLLVQRLLATVTGAFTLTGNSVNLVRSYLFVAETGTFALTGITINFSRAYVLPTETGSYALTGNNADLDKVYLLLAETGTFTLSGNTVTFAQSYLLDAETGSFTLTGYDADIDKLYILDAETGEFTLTSFDVGFSQAYVLSAETGSFTLTGNAVSFSSEGQLSVLPGSFTLTGNNADLRVNRLLSTEASSFVVSGQSASLIASRLISAAISAFVLTGYDIDFFFGSALAAETGTFTLTGNNISTSRVLILNAEPGTFALTGLAANITYSADTTLLFTPRTGLFTPRTSLFTKRR